MNLVLLTLFSGFFQLIGYFYYVTKTNKDDISPNPTTWLIFAFDTTILVLLEAVAGASFNLLFLPSMCALGAIYVAFLVRKAGKLHWPKDKMDQYILSVAIIVTLLYAIIFILWHYTLLPSSAILLTTIVFLILSNINTLIAFIPIIKEVAIDPHHEHAGPWMIWTIAYSLLTVVTYFEVGFSMSGLIFYLYPVSCVLLHGIMAWLARDKRKVFYSKSKNHKY